MEKFSDIAKFLLELSDKASKIMLEHYSAAGVPAEIKEDMSPVTKTDLAINDMVIEEIKERYPEFGVLAEERSTSLESIDKLFVIDPLDGTQMFKIGCPLFVFSAAVVIEGKAVAGILMNPLARRTLLAEKGKGTYFVEENKFVSVSDKKDLSGALINSGWKETSVPKAVHDLGGRTPQVYAVCEAASLVATGGFDGEVCTTKSPHDIAAAKIVVEEAGGMVTGLAGEEQLYNQKINGAIISNKYLHPKLLEIIKNVWADTTT